MLCKVKPRRDYTFGFLPKPQCHGMSDYAFGQGCLTAVFEISPCDALYIMREHQMYCCGGSLGRGVDERTIYEIREVIDPIV